MLPPRFTPAIAATVLLALAPLTYANKVIPCAIGSGTDNGCSYCDDDKGIEITSWSSATKSENFDLPEAAAKNGGGGYDVWWNIPQPDAGCRIIITAGFSTDKGSYDSRISGNTIISTAHGGCYFGHVGPAGVSAGACCGTGDCGTANAQLKKRELPMSRIARGLIRDVEARGWGGSPPPQPETPAEATPGFTCTAPKSQGDTYTKSGKQQIDGQTLVCTGGETCGMTPSMSVSASDSLMNEKSVTSTSSIGGSISIMGGFMMMPGWMGSITGTVSHDQSKAITDAFSETNTQTITKTLTLSVGVVPGPSFNLWFTPTIRCQSYATTCDGIDMSMEKCQPILDGSGNPTGEHGVMVVG